jgi:type 1 glutamine amidotransferase
MDLTSIHSRRSIIKTGLVAAAAAAASPYKVEAELPLPEPKKPGEIKIVGAMGHDYRLETGIRPIMSRIKNARVWFARYYGPITPEFLIDTDLLITYYAGDSFEWSPSGLADTAGTKRSSLYTPENIKAIKDGIINRGMGWIAVHNTPWFVGDELCNLIGADPMLHREIQPVIIRNLNQNHPITKGIEPFIIQLDEQFGLYLRNPKDPDVKVLFKSQGVHDKHITIQGVCSERGKGRIVCLTPGHYEWTWYEVQYRELIWRTAHWALNLPIEPFYEKFEDYIW